ncbi:MAG: orotidine-5'-phosphate decarboxylase [Clostridia bacterium]|nr:orotidine-5'-phosphate decarboxylase [Clostridia bacterium]
MSVIDRLIENTIRTRNPSVVGLDPDIAKMPACYQAELTGSNPFEAAAEVIAAFNRDVIDAVADLVPAVKPQTAFYEQYGSHGVAALEKTIAYAKAKGLVVVEDAKRNDVGNTALAYANGHLGSVGLPDGSCAPSLDVDFLTVTPYLGREGLQPFVDACARYYKGVFILVRTSNPGSGEIQEAAVPGGLTVCRRIAQYVAEQAEACTGRYGYSPIGAVVGATYPEEAAELRRLMSKSWFLVPGYGAQGGGARDVLPCFHPDGLGAVVNSSRAILYTHMSSAERARCTKAEYLQSVRAAAQRMQAEIHAALKAEYGRLVY